MIELYFDLNNTKFDVQQQPIEKKKTQPSPLVLEDFIKYTMLCVSVWEGFKPDIYNGEELNRHIENLLTRGRTFISFDNYVLEYAFYGISLSWVLKKRNTRSFEDGINFDLYISKGYSSMLEQDLIEIFSPDIVSKALVDINRFSE